MHIAIMSVPSNSTRRPPWGAAAQAANLHCCAAAPAASATGMTLSLPQPVRNLQIIFRRCRSSRCRLAFALSIITTHNSIRAFQGPDASPKPLAFESGTLQESMYLPHLALHGGQLVAVHCTHKQGVGQAHNEASPERGCQIHLEKQDAHDHGHPRHLQTND